MPIYTKTGDTGTTALYGGKRVLKCHELVDVYGSIDELNSWIGLLAAHLTEQDVHTFFMSLQSDLFTIGGFLAGWHTVELHDLEPRIKKMEARIDVLDNDLPKLTNFVLPGGTELSSRVHIARAICRRVERQVVGLQTKDIQDVQEIKESEFHLIIRYFNRLSDMLFMLARFVNYTEGIVEVTWSGIDRNPKKK